MPRIYGTKKPRDEIVSNIVMHLRMHACTTSENCLPMSTLGIVGFGDRDFRRKQDAAFAVSRIVRHMLKQEILRHGEGGYYLNQKAVIL